MVTKAFTTFCLVSFSSIFSGVACLVVFAVLYRQQNVQVDVLRPVAIATGISLVIAVAVTNFLLRYHAALNAVLVASLFRMMLTLGIAGILGYKDASFRTVPFVLTLAIIYIVNLTIETWLVVKSDRYSN